MRICLDFDGVIHDTNPAVRVHGYRMGPPVVGALLACRVLLMHHDLVIHTARATEEHHLPHIYAWLEYFDFPVIPVALAKPLADVYVDDKAVRFTDWDHTLHALSYLAAGLGSKDGRSHSQVLTAEERAVRARRRYRGILDAEQGVDGAGEG